MVRLNVQSQRNEGGARGKQLLHRHVRLTTFSPNGNSAMQVTHQLSQGKFFPACTDPVPGEENTVCKDSSWSSPWAVWAGGVHLLLMGLLARRMYFSLLVSNLIGTLESHKKKSSAGWGSSKRVVLLREFLLTHPIGVIGNCCVTPQGS